ncbi:A/G-specific adenine glycosylase [Orrella marina]|uniref:Adenine DNA glycosylase n=2 Tax=Orrella marina TaxID=2163011 RepID=A0A2R4XQ13_9BURK|nr:A/G-specific adenine glycosylase [Orrella marina]
MTPSSTRDDQALKIAPTLIRWQRSAGRNHLPWQNTADPYRIWLSEIMLQQTQVATVIPYYQRFLERFPDVISLAHGSLDEVMALWAGLGYYSRAKNLHACAKRIEQDWQGSFPPDSRSLETLPGIGRSTAAAIAAFCYGERAAILDGNVRRVFCRFFGIEGDPGSRQTLLELWALAELALPSSSFIETQPDGMRRYTQGLMDLGATVCTRSRPDCQSCPLRTDCTAVATGRTDSLPTPKKRKIRHEKDVHVLLMTWQNAVYLHRRPDKGIWANLWSLPDAPTEPDLKKVLTTLADKIVPRLEPMAAFSHELTHFRMVIRPWRASLPDDAALPALTNTDREQWVKLEELGRYGIPAAIRPLIEGITQTCHFS